MIIGPQILSSLARTKNSHKVPRISRCLALLVIRDSGLGSAFAQAPARSRELRQGCGITPRAARSGMALGV